MDLAFDWDVVLKMLLGTFFGSTIGAERYAHGRPAGLRTHLLVCVAFTSIAILSGRLTLLGESSFTMGLRSDPGRLMAGGLTGIGFLGAGIIIQSGGTVHGLTTAAALWVVSVLGLAVGSGHYSLAIILYLITLPSLVCLRYVEPRLKRDTYKDIELSIRRSSASLKDMAAVIEGQNLHVRSVGLSEDRASDQVVYQFTVYGKKEEPFHRAYQELSSREEIKWIKLKSRNLA